MAASASATYDEMLHARSLVTLHETIFQRENSDWAILWCDITSFSNSISEANFTNGTICWVQFILLGISVHLNFSGARISSIFWYFFFYLFLNFILILILFILFYLFLFLFFLHADCKLQIKMISMNVYIATF